jgi:hypothetical protein
MNKLLLAAVGLACCTVGGAADYISLSASCIGLDEPGTKRCMDIIARHSFGALAKIRDLTLAERTAFDAILAADPKAILVVLPDGNVEVGQFVTSRSIGIPCASNPCKGTPAKP